MNIKNLTSDTQKIIMQELVGDRRCYDIFVAPYGTTDLGREGIILNLESLEGSIEVMGIPKAKEEIKAPESPAAEETVETPKKEEVTDKFICEECGAEFASARGLASHKNKTHQ